MSAETSKRKQPGAHEVGKCHPPKNTQFKKGQSGNPLGRPKKPVHVGTTIDGLLNRKITVLVDGKRVKISGAEALLRKAFNEALKGDYRMMKLFWLSRNSAQMPQVPSITLQTMRNLTQK